MERIQGQGSIKASVEFTYGLRAQLWAHPPERFGTALQYATGSKDHNVRLRELALKQGLSLSEHSLERKDGSEILCAREEEVYAALGLPWIPPELREDRGEVQAARDGTLPRLIELADIQAELHTHSTWSDGKLSILEMAQAAQKRGLKLLAITDHSFSLGVAGGHDHRRRPPAAPGDPGGPAPGGRLASACSRAPRWRSAPTAAWTTRTRCWLSWISSALRCTPACASRARRSPSARSTPSATRTSI